MCAVATAAASESVAWPGAIPITASQLKTITPGQIKGFAYSTSQYINAVCNYNNKLSASRCIPHTAG